MPHEYAWLAAGAAGLTAAWGQVRGLLSRFTSLLFVQVEVSDIAAADFMAWAWQNLRRVPYGKKLYGSFYDYVRPTQRYEEIACEWSGESLTFFHGWAPIFTSFSNGGQKARILSVSFIRGTFNFEKVFGAAIDAKNQIEFQNQVGHRYRVSRVYGNNGIKNTIEPGEKGEPSSPSAHSDKRGSRPIRYELIELGAPSNGKPFEALAYSAEVKEILEELRRWKKSKDWYQARGLAWRFAVMPFGLPGTGKTSFARAVAQEFDFPIHSYDLGSMDNRELNQSWKNSLSKAPCMVLIEDIDRIFHGDKNLAADQDGRFVTLDGLLNCISGAEPADGILLFVTANNIENIDPALGIPKDGKKSTRPGRIDRAVCFGTLGVDERRLVAKRILAGFEDMQEDIVLDGEGETGAQFTNRCETAALARYWSDRA